MASTQRPNGLKISTERAKASKEGTARSWIEIFSASPPGDWRCRISILRPGRCATALVASASFRCSIVFSVQAYLGFGPRVWPIQELAEFQGALMSRFGGMMHRQLGRPLGRSRAKLIDARGRTEATEKRNVPASHRLRKGASHAKILPHHDDDRRSGCGPDGFSRWFVGRGGPAPDGRAAGKRRDGSQALH